MTPTTTMLEAIDDDWIMPAIPASSIPLVEITTPENENPSEEPHPASDIPVTLEISSSSPSGKPPSPDVSSSTSPSPVVTETKDTPTAPAEILGRGQRTKKPSVLLRDFVTKHVHSSHALTPDYSDLSSTSTVSGKVLYPIAQCLSDSGFSASHIAFMAAVLDSNEPKYFKDAVLIKEWCEAMQLEITALESNHTWDLTDLPPGKKAINCKWVYKLKFRADGTLERYKARLVVMGNRQKEGVDYKETFAHVAKMTTVRYLLSVAAAKEWEVHQMDVHNAFLHGDLAEEVYMKLPPGFHSYDPTKVCRLRKSLYGLKQAPRCWFAKLSTALKKLGFKQSYQDYSLFLYKNGATILHVLVYVDDFIVAGNNLGAVQKFKAQLHKCFHMKDLGKLKYFLGIEVSRGSDGFYLSQRKYALDIISEAGLLGSKPSAVPMELNHKLGSATGPLFAKPEQYRRLVGRFIYLTISRPDLSYAVHIMSQFMQKPLVAHWEATLWLVRYLKGTPAQAIILR